MIFSAYLSYNEFSIEPNMLMRIFKMSLAINFSEIYLGYKGLLRLNIL